MNLGLKLALTLVFILSVNINRLGVRTTQASTTGEDVSSLITECLNILPRYPPPNQFACYRTRTRSVGPFQTCDATLVRETLIPMLFGNENFTQFYIQTPGRLRGRSYNNRLLCRWNVECRNDQLLYLDVTEHNIEPKQQSSLFRREVCADYLELIRDFGRENSCGFRNPYTEVEPHRIRMEFRSNTKLRFPGFRMRIACFNPELQDLEGCSPTDDIALEQLESLRKKRYVHEENEDSLNKENETRKIPFHSRYLQYFDKVSPILGNTRERRKRSLSEQMVIDKTATLYFRDNLLLVSVNKTFVKYSFQNIDVVHTYNVYHGIESFHSYPDTLQAFRGRGVLTVINNAAFYVTYGLDLERFQPSENERIVIRVLMEVEERMLNLPPQDFVIEDKDHYYYGTDSPPPGLGAGNVREKRQLSAIEPEVIEAARRGVNSCNAVLRGVAQSVLELIN
ncbi:uncharacterized protein LOC135337982 [Halichondria panicea]|uniref:uncharacterized protein LOC135337982 n=1 Tax=Halichondria panicea TaxID=6063 RepID=UPI00312BBC92